jgi:hypothetical protein
LRGFSKGSIDQSAQSTIFDGLQVYLSHIVGGGRPLRLRRQKIK